MRTSLGFALIVSFAGFPALADESLLSLVSRLKVSRDLVYAGVDVGDGEELRRQIAVLRGIEFALAPLGVSACGKVVVALQSLAETALQPLTARHKIYMDNSRRIVAEYMPTCDSVSLNPALIRQPE